MKNLPCYIFLATFASIALLVTVSFLGVSFPVMDIAAYGVGYAAAAGVLALGCTDGPSRPLRPAARAAVTKAEVKTAASRRNNSANRPEWPGTVSAADSALTTLGVANDPATVSMM